MININGNPYAYDDPVTWKDAVEEGGFYFSRACYLGIPRPPAILFDRDHPGYLAAMGRYHELFARAEARHIQQWGDEE